MSWISVLRFYLETNALLVLAFCWLTGVRLVIPWWALSQNNWLRLAKVSVCLALLLPLAATQLPTQSLLRPSAQIWSTTRLAGGGDTMLLRVPPTLEPRVPNRRLEGVTLSKELLEGVAVFLLVGIFCALFKLLLDWRELRRALRSTVPIKSIGRVRLLASDSTAAYSARFGLNSYVVLPMEIFAQPRALSLALRHEIQHHRQRDTSWAHFLELVKAFCFWNPAVLGLRRSIHTLQEFACDEALVVRQRFSTQEYSLGLVAAAKYALREGAIPAGTTGMAASRGRSTLKRRIEMILLYPNQPPKRAVSLVVSLGTLVVLASAAFASRSAVQDRRLSLADVERLARKIEAKSEIPVEVNELVLGELNRFVGTPHSRLWFREGLGRMAKYSELIHSKLALFRLPKDLMAVPLIESGFANLDQHATSHSEAPGSGGAGLWQFIPNTARRYGLKVTPEIDERLDEEKLTVAAMQYFSDLYAEFDDWKLAVAAYNMGEVKVRQEMKAQGTTDAWVLARKKRLNEYLARTVAAIIILHNPTLVD